MKCKICEKLTEEDYCDECLEELETLQSEKDWQDKM